MENKRTSEWYNKQLQGLFAQLKEQSNMIDSQFILKRLNDIMSEKGILFHRTIMQDLGINTNGDILHKVPYDPKSPLDGRKMLLKGYELYVDKQDKKWWRQTIYSGQSK